MDQPYDFQDDATEDDYLVRYVDGRLTVDVVNMPLEDLLMEVGRQSGARVRIEGLDNRTVTDAFTQLALDAALRRLVAGKNFSVTYVEQRAPNGNVVGTRLKELNVYGGPASVSTSPPGSSAADSLRPIAAGLGALPSAPARTLGDRNEQKPKRPSQKSEKVEPTEEHNLAETPEAEPPEFANPVTAAILGKRPEPVEEPPSLEEPFPLPEEMTPFSEELPPLHEEVEGEPAAEDEWHPDFEVDEPGQNDEGEYEGDGYD